MPEKVSAFEAQVKEWQGFKTQWLEAKARNSELNSVNDDLRRELKSAQDELAAGKEKVAAKEAAQDELKSATTALEGCRAENGELERRLARAKKRIGALETQIGAFFAA